MGILQIRKLLIDLLICSKAFSYSTSAGAFPKGMVSTFDLACHIEQKLLLDSDLGIDFYALFAGPGAEEKICTHDATRIRDIISFNCFSGKNFEEKDSQNAPKSTGIWIMRSYINHSCSGGNAAWQIYGDVIFIRATVLIPKGEEVLIS